VGQIADEAHEVAGGRARHRLAVGCAGMAGKIVPLPLEKMIPRYA